MKVKKRVQHIKQPLGVTGGIAMTVPKLGPLLSLIILQQQQFQAPPQHLLGSQKRTQQILIIDQLQQILQPQQLQRTYLTLQQQIQNVQPIAQKYLTPSVEQIW